jgi:hypothetical protein
MRIPIPKAPRPVAVMLQITQKEEEKEQEKVHEQ